MAKTLFRILLFIFLLGTPTLVSATPADAPACSSATETQSDIKITVRGTNLRVTGAAGQTLEIYSVTGARLKSVKISANEETVSTGLARGCYIVKVGDVVRKINLV
ncbi:MAG: T9SS type A sorting domain-containing protein [Bacteroidaceae bacterium]|nr:T9SS type A sorting domain-containing protein [Bacteroidaceae bacterium]